MVMLLDLPQWPNEQVINQWLAQDGQYDLSTRPIPI